MTIKIIYLVLVLWGADAMGMELKSAAFGDHQNIPSRYTCEGENISPPLNWYNVPGSTKSLVLVVDDPDAVSGVWDHWIVYNIPVSMNHLPENYSPQTPVQFGQNSWKKNEYGGPCPPTGVHHYRFTLYAVNDILPAKPGFSKSEIEKLMAGKVLEKNLLTGIYKKKQ